VTLQIGFYTLRKLINKGHWIPEEVEDFDHLKDFQVLKIDYPMELIEK
jgi:hypothetical protein